MRQRHEAPAPTNVGADVRRTGFENWHSAVDHLCGDAPSGSRSSLFRSIGDPTGLLIQNATDAEFAVLAAVFAQVTLPAATLAAWEPTRPVEFVVPAGTGGGADLARTIQGIVIKRNLLKQPMVVINKAGGAGGEGFP
jgi:hypothetical protein